MNLGRARCFYSLYGLRCAKRFANLKFFTFYFWSFLLFTFLLLKFFYFLLFYFFTFLLLKSCCGWCGAPGREGCKSWCEAPGSAKGRGCNADSAPPRGPHRQFWKFFLDLALCWLRPHSLYALGLRPSFYSLLKSFNSLRKRYQSALTASTAFAARSASPILSFLLFKFFTF